MMPTAGARLQVFLPVLANQQLAALGALYRQIPRN